MSRALTLRLTNTAEADLADIWAYVAAEASAVTASRLIGNIKDACDPLCVFPEAGTAREQFGAGLRVTFAGSYAIYYIHDEREVIVIRVLHGARDAAALAERGGFA